MENLSIKREHLNLLILNATGWYGFNNIFKIVKMKDLYKYTEHEAIWEHDLDKSDEYIELAKRCNEDECVTIDSVEASLNDVVKFLDNEINEYEENNSDDNFSPLHGDYQILQLLREIAYSNSRAGKIESILSES